MSDATRDRDELFVELYSRAQRSIFGYIYLLVPHHADAENLLSETSLVLWRKFPEFDPDRDFVAWACGIARNKVLNYFKSRQRDRISFNEDLLAQLADTRLARSKVHAGYAAALQTCLNKLSDVDRRLVDLCYGGAETIKAAAEQLGRPAASVYVSLNRVRGALQDCIRRAVSTEGDAS
jgi:RNA polymerase sigma-70 factor (ECF subfamily)